MKLVKKITFLTIFSFLSFINIQAQIDVLTDEISHKNELVYYENNPLTGTLYSNDEIEIPNNCQCTLKEKYTNGVLNGLKQEWYTSGKPKFKGEYINGKPDKTHIYYNTNGKPIKKIVFENGITVLETGYDTNGDISFEIPYKNGKKSGEKKAYHNGKISVITTYKNDKKNGLEKYFTQGEITQEKEYKNDQLIKIANYENKQLKKEILYNNLHQTIKTYSGNKLQKIETFKNNSNAIKDGIFKVFDANGNLISEKFYINNRLQNSGNYRNKQKEGEWISYTDDFTIKTIKTFKNGKEVAINVINTNDYLINYPLKITDEVIIYQDIITNTENYYILRMPSLKYKNTEEKKVIKEAKHLILKRVNILPKENYSGEKVVKGIIIGKNFNISHKVSTYERTKQVNGVAKKINVPNYQAIIKYSFNVTDNNNILIKNYDFEIDSQGSLGRQFLNATIGAFTPSPSQALLKAIKRMQVHTLNADLFPIKAKITSVTSQTSTKIKTVKINKGSYHNVQKKMSFYLYDEDNKTRTPKLKVTKVDVYSSECKVLKNNELIKIYIDSHNETFIEEGK